MGDKMTFPETIEDFIKDYSFKDKEEVYTNGADLIPVFRVEQAIEYYSKKIINDFINKIIKSLNECDRYTSEFITHCLNGNIYSKNEVFIVDDIYELINDLRG